jgi:[acyl-carrier-protein] S-malonyltransferase
MEALSDVELSDMSLPVITNVEATPNIDSKRVKELLVKQVSAPVRWDESVTQMINLGVGSFIEIGPGKVLLGLIKRIDKSVNTTNVEDVSSLKSLT